MMHHLHRLSYVSALVLLLTACGTSAAASTPRVVDVTALQAQPATAAPAALRRKTPEPTATPEPTTLPTADSTTIPLTPTVEISATATVSDTAPVSATATPDLATLRYVFPVQNSRVVTYGRYHHDYPAADMFTAIGSAFVAPTSGVVDFVRREDRWNPKTDDPAERGGLAVAIIGDDGVRYYGSHLSAVLDGIEPGVRVEAGQQLGLTGKTGDARFTQAHLHFGISHPTTPDDWAVRRGEIYPYKYLRCWQNPPITGACPRPADELFGQ